MSGQPSGAGNESVLKDVFYSVLSGGPFIGIFAGDGDLALTHLSIWTIDGGRVRRTSERYRGVIVAGGGFASMLGVARAVGPNGQSSPF